MASFRRSVDLGAFRREPSESQKENMNPNRLSHDLTLGFKRSELPPPSSATKNAFGCASSGSTPSRQIPCPRPRRSLHHSSSNGFAAWSQASAAALQQSLDGACTTTKKSKRKTDRPLMVRRSLQGPISQLNASMSSTTSQRSFSALNVTPVLKTDVTPRRETNRRMKNVKAKIDTGLRTSVTTSKKATVDPNSLRHSYAGNPGSLSDLLRDSKRATCSQPRANSMVRAATEVKSRSARKTFSQTRSASAMKMSESALKSSRGSCCNGLFRQSQDSLFRQSQDSNASSSVLPIPEHSSLTCSFEKEDGFRARRTLRLDESCEDSEMIHRRLEDESEDLCLYSEEVREQESDSIAGRRKKRLQMFAKNQVNSSSSTTVGNSTCKTTRDGKNGENLWGLEDLLPEQFLRSLDFHEEDPRCLGAPTPKNLLGETDTIQEEDEDLLDESPEKVKAKRKSGNSNGSRKLICFNKSDSF